MITGTPLADTAIDCDQAAKMGSAIGRFRRGEMPLAHTFWLGWALPVVGGNLMLVASDAGWLGGEADPMTYYALSFVVALYAVCAAMPVWRSAAAYAGPGVWRAGACAAALAALAINLVGLVSVAGLVTGLGASNEAAAEPLPTCGEDAARLET